MWLRSKTARVLWPVTVIATHSGTSGLAQIAEGHARPGLVKRLRDAETDAGARTRDENRVIPEVEHPVLSVHHEDGPAGKPAGHQVLRHLPDLLPRSLEADVRREHRALLDMGPSRFV
jgi:hypothetical protein